MSYIDELGKKAKSAAKNSAMLSQSLKNDILATIAAMLENGRDEIKKANELDITAAHEYGGFYGGSSYPYRCQNRRYG